MTTMKVHLDESGKNFLIITPFAQGAEWNSKTRFDGRWQELALHLTRSENYRKRKFSKIELL